MTKTELAKIIQDEAAACFKSAKLNGQHSSEFHVCGIVLVSIADRLVGSKLHREYQKHETK